MSDVFFSYARGDSDGGEQVRKLIAALESVGVDMFWDRHIPGGQDFVEVLQTEMFNAKCFVIAWDTKASESPWVREECLNGFDKRCLVPVKIEKDAPTFLFKSVQAVDLSDWDGLPSGPSWDALVDAIGRHLRAAEKGEQWHTRGFDQVPMLRRYCRALAGSQARADQWVEGALQNMPDDLTALRQGANLKLALFTALHQKTPMKSRAERCAKLLIDVEGFNRAEAAQIIGSDEDAIAELYRRATVEEQGRDRCRILYMEDEENIRTPTIESLMAAGHGVVAAVDNGLQAISAARKNLPDLIVADIQLIGDMNGIEAVAEIRKFLDVPVVYTTYYPELLLSGRREEPVFVLAKPVHNQTLLAVIDQIAFNNAKRRPH